MSRSGQHKALRRLTGRSLANNGKRQPRQRVRTASLQAKLYRRARGMARTSRPRAEARGQPARCSGLTPEVQLAVPYGIGVLRRLLYQLRRQLHHPAVSRYLSAVARAPAREMSQRAPRPAARQHQSQPPRARAARPPGGSNRKSHTPLPLSSRRLGFLLRVLARRLSTSLLLGSLLGVSGVWRAPDI